MNNNPAFLRWRATCDNQKLNSNRKLAVCCRFTSCLSFYSILNELNDYAGQRELVAEEMAHRVYGELMKYSQDLKAERKHVSFKAPQRKSLSMN